MRQRLMMRTPTTSSVHKLLTPGRRLKTTFATLSRSLQESTETGKPAKHKNSRARRVIFSGIQPTGVPHLGNFLGALRTWKQLQDAKTREKDPKNLQLYFSIVDLHALTVQQNAQEFYQHRVQTYASLRAIGLDPQHSSLFFQSDIAAHSQLMWLLSTVASTGYLSRMTQWKSKLGVADDATLDDVTAREKLRLGLFAYPVLQAADILLYKPTHVPVGEDQAQHIEFARSLARSFNAQYGTRGTESKLVPEPKLMLSPAKRIMSLKNPSSKMSKSHKQADSRVLITDSPEEVHRKFKAALTDSTDGISYDPETRPGVSNLIEILKHMTVTDLSCEDLAHEHKDLSMKAFKELVADAVVRELDGIGDKFEYYMGPGLAELQHSMREGKRMASAKAGDTLKAIQKSIGLSSPHKWTTDTMSSERRDQKRRIEGEQEEEEKQKLEETIVVPQKDAGLDLPVAS